MSSLVNYSESDDSSVDSNASPLPCPFTRAESDLHNPGNQKEEDFFQLKSFNDNANFWNTTSSDADLLPSVDCLSGLETKLTTTTSSSTGHQFQSIVSDYRRDSPRPQRNSNLSVLFEIPAEDHLTAKVFETIPFYPRLSLQWPFLAYTVPPINSDRSGSMNLRLYKLTHLTDPSCSGTQRAQRLPNPTPSGVQDCGALVSCVAFTGPCMAQRTTCQLFTGYVHGLVHGWDMISDKPVHQVNASIVCDHQLRCMAVPNSQLPKTGLLTGSARGVIGLWDLRVPSSTRPQQTFAHSGQTHSTSDLLWLTETQFASTSDTVDRNVCDPNLSVWDTRFTKTISHQLYQERWGCSRLVGRPMSSPLGFAVQTHGNAIVEIWGAHKPSQTSSNETHYRLERRWRYEGHDCQAHPLGLAYNSNGTFLASACWGCVDPVIWHAKRGRTQQPGDMFHKPHICDHPNLMLTDVLWVPSQVTRAAGCGHQLIGIQSNGNVRVCQLRVG